MTSKYHIAPLVVSESAFGVGAYQATDADADLIFQALKGYGFLLVDLLPSKRSKREVVRRFTFSEFADLVEKQGTSTEKVDVYVGALRRAHQRLMELTDEQVERPAAV